MKKAKGAGAGRRRASRDEPAVEVPWPRPQTEDELHAWLRTELKVDVPREAIVAGHTAPFAYVAHAFFHDHAPDAAGPGDCVVWANRGGGKTFLGAVATLLDLVFKPGIEIRILAGSMEQAQRMHTHLRRLFKTETLASLIAGRMTER